jgi:hypothetical protein
LPLAPRLPSPRTGFVEATPIAASSLDYSRAEAAADARRQRVKLYSEYCEPFATKQMRPDRLARRVKTQVLVFLVCWRNTAFSGIVQAREALIGEKGFLGPKKIA